MSTLLKIFITVAMVAMVLGQESPLESINNYNLAKLNNIKFFKYPGKLTPYGIAPGNTNPSLTQRARAMLKYMRDVAMGHPHLRENAGMEIDEKTALRLRPAYQRQFGYLGEKLVAMMGNGHAAQDLRHYGAIGRDMTYSER